VTENTKFKSFLKLEAHIRDSSGPEPSAYSTLLQGLVQDLSGIGIIWSWNYLDQELRVSCPAAGIAYKIYSCKNKQGRYHFYKGNCILSEEEGNN